ncbi:MAG: hypothetical protein A4E65_02448 [Syntrophorhabdus sp. PtaU1.Bin153]|nr:MAG: hypothetical protein A4E65_02448 [Syntrophorhabdus sp. PtaU1.Bin153]
MKSRFCFGLVCLMLLAFLPCLLSAQQSNRYRNKDHAFRITFPDNWTVRPGYGPNAVVNAGNSEGSSISVIVKVMPKELAKYDLNDMSDVDLYQHITDSVNGMRQVYPDAKLIDRGITHLSNKRAVWFQVSSTMRHIGGPMKAIMLQVQAINKGKVFIITCGSPSDSYHELHPVFMESLASFFFEDKAWYRK